MSPWQQKLRKAIGSVKDHTTISVAKVAGAIAPELEVALVKATSHDNCHVEERHVQEVIFLASASTAYTMACITHLSRRLSRTQNWIVAVKTLMLIHRLLKEADHSFQDDLFRESRAGDGILYLSGFQDDSVSCGWEYSAFVRTYALYLDELLDYNVSNCGGSVWTDSGRLSSSSSSSCGRRSGSDTFTAAMEGPAGLGSLNVSFKDMKPLDLLEKMPAVQRMLDRVLACHPAGAAGMDHFVQSALGFVVKDSFQFYDSVGDGLVILLNAFFKMEGAEAARAFEIYTMAAKQAEALLAFYGLCKDILGWRSSEYPFVQRIPEELLETMETYLQSLMVKTMVENQEASAAQPVAPTALPAEQICPNPSTANQLTALSTWAADSKFFVLNNTAPNKDQQGKNLAPLPPMLLTNVSSPWQAFFNREVLQVSNRQARADDMANGCWLVANGFADHMPLLFNTLVKDGLSNGLSLGRLIQEQESFHQMPTLSFPLGQSSNFMIPQNEAPSLLPSLASNTQYGDDPFAASSSIPPPLYVQASRMKQNEESFLQAQMPQGQYPSRDYRN